MQKIKNINPFWLIALSIVFGLTLPILIQDGMFQDAVLYSAVAHNQSIGFGTFWFPQYSTLNLENIASFHEQPPLFFGIQAIFYNIFGDSMYVERGYTFFMIVINVWLINYLWKMVFKHSPELSQYGWLAVIIWITIPVCFWSYRNNMIENTVSVFTLSSIIINFKNIETQNPKTIWWLMSGCFIFLASFTKGVPGLFPITFPFLYWLIFRNISFKKCLSYSTFLILIPFLIYALLLTYPPAHESLSIYFYERLIRRVNQMPTADYRLEILWRLVKELIPAITMILLIYFLAGWDKIKAYFLSNAKVILLLIGIGLSGSVPLTLTMVQKGWYMVPSFPYFALAVAVLIVPFFYGRWGNTEAIRKNKFVQATAIMAIITVLIITTLQIGKISREKEVLQDVYIIGKIVPKFSTITVPNEMYDQYDFVLQGFLVRYFNISISPYQQYDYYLKEKELAVDIPSNYQKVEAHLKKYELYVSSEKKRITK